MTPVVWLHTVEEDGVLAYRMGRRGGSIVVEWPQLARLTCANDGTRVRLTPKAGAPRRAVTKLRGVVNALVGDLRGNLGVHAAAVAVGSQGVLLLGDNGAGKSTAAAGLCLRHGASLLSDDAAVLEIGPKGVLVLPSEANHCLSRESGDALGIKLPARSFERAWKATVRPRRSASRAVPLALVAALRFDDSLREPVCAPLGGAEAVRRLLSALFRLDLSDRSRELDRVLQVYDQAVFVDVARPRSSPEIGHLVVRALEASPAAHHAR